MKSTLIAITFLFTGTITVFQMCNPTTEATTEVTTDAEQQPPLALQAVSQNRVKEVRDSINNQTQRYYTNLVPDRDKAVSTELGGIIFNSQAMGLNTNASCAGSSCHMPSNNLGPIAKMQGGEGVLFMKDGFVECKFYPKNLGKDIMEINTPMSRGIVFKQLALSKGQARKEEQPSLMFGATVHQIDFEKLNQIDVMEYYVANAFKVSQAEEIHYTQALMDYQEQFEWDETKYVQWLDGKNNYKYIGETVTMLWDKGCMKCHGGAGGISDEFGNVVLNSTGNNPTDTTRVLTRSWFGGNTMPAMYWGGSYATDSRAGDEKHFSQEGITLTDAEMDAWIYFRNQCLNIK